MGSQGEIVKIQPTPEGRRLFIHHYDEAVGSHRWVCDGCHWEREFIVGPKNQGTPIDPIHDSYDREFDEHVCAKHRGTQSN